MNRRFVFRLLGKMLMVTSALMVLPLIVSIIYKEESYTAFLLSIGISLAIGFPLMTFSKTEDRVIYAKEGFVIVALSWLCMSAVGALPFVLSEEIPSYVDAFFETVSGFTTTGASILTDVEAMSHGLLFWRSFTHWVGGMGVLVFVMAIIPASTDRSIHILRAEVPGPIVGKLVPKMRDTAIILYLIYIVLTVIEIVMLLIGGMPLFDSIVHAFGTAGTGGFGLKNDSLAGYSPYLQNVTTVFMTLFGVNFSIYYLLLLKEFRSAEGAVRVMASRKMDSVSSVAPSVMGELRDTILDSIRTLKADPGTVNQAKQVFQGVNTMINLAKMELEYRKYVDDFNAKAVRGGKK